MTFYNSVRNVAINATNIASVYLRYNAVRSIVHDSVFNATYDSLDNAINFGVYNYIDGRPFDGL